jgi:hypothetical protein
MLFSSKCRKIKNSIGENSPNLVTLAAALVLRDFVDPTYYIRRIFVEQIFVKQIFVDPKYSLNYCTWSGRRIFIRRIYESTNLRVDEFTSRRIYESTNLRVDEFTSRRNHVAPLRSENCCQRRGSLLHYEIDLPFVYFQTYLLLMYRS